MRLALVAAPHAVAGPAINEAEAISAAAHRAWAVFAGEKSAVDAERGQDLAPPAVRTFLGRDRLG
jgi:hypothetical protein